MLDTVGPIETDSKAPSSPDVVYVSLELSRTKWLVTSLSAGGEKISRHVIADRDQTALLSLLEQLKGRAERRSGRPVKIVSIQEAGFDGFWIHRVLIRSGIESHVVESASIAVSRRHRRAKSDAIDGEMLLRTLMAFRRGEPRVCAMVVPPTPEEEDQRRVSRERRTLIKERVEHVNRIKGLLASQGISDFQPLRRDSRGRLDALTTGDGRPLPPRLRAEICRELDRIELVQRQLAAVEVEREKMLQSDQAKLHSSPGKLLLQLRGIGPEFASVLWLEGLYRRFDNRRQLAAYAGLAPSPWQSGKIRGEQGISKSGNSRLRSTMMELAWLWLRHQSGSALSRWFHERVQSDRGRIRRISIVALARKLLIALWRYTSFGEVPEGAQLKVA
jgi:transposase